MLKKMNKTRLNIATFRESMAFSSSSDSFYPPNWHQQQPSGVIQHEIPSGNASAKPGSMLDRARIARVPLPEAGLKCPRCDSTNTKFCYFNNYNLSQPRHFCKACRRYWTRGGALRNVPVGGGFRKGRTKATKVQSSQRSVSANATRFVSEPVSNLPYLSSGFSGQQSSNLLTGSGLQANGLHPFSASGVTAESHGLNLSKNTMMGNNEEYQYSNWGSGNVWTDVSGSSNVSGYDYRGPNLYGID